MSRGKSQFLSGFGTAFQVFKTITDAVLAAGGNDEDLRRILSDKELASDIAKVIVGEVSRHKITVDYNQTLAQMIQAGRYDWVKDGITQKNFPILGEGKQEVVIELLHFNRSISSEDALKKMKKQGLRPARIEELLALGAAYPDPWKQFPIVALGSVWPSYDHCNVPYLNLDGDKRNLQLHWFEPAWLEYYRFAVVRNAS